MSPTDPRDPHEPPPQGDDTHAPRHEGVVESLREEVQELHDRVEDAVEHALPQKARRSAGRIAWLIVLSTLGLVVVLVAGGLAWLTQHTEYLAGHLTVVVNRLLADHSDLVLEMRDVRGNAFRSVTIVEPRLRFRGDVGPALLEARSMSLGYAPWDLAFGSRRSLEITFDRPVVHLARGADGKLRLPRWRSGRAKRGPGREFDVRLSVTGGAVYLPDSSQDVRGLDVQARALLGKQDEIEILRMSWARGPLDTRLEELRGRLVAGDSTQFKLEALRTPDLALSAAGGWRRGAQARFASVELERVSWRWLARVFANELFDVSGQGGGHFDVRFDGAVSGTGVAEAVWDSVPLKARAGFRWKGGQLTVAPLDGTSPAGSFQGRVTYTASNLDLRGHVTHGNPVFWHAIGLAGWPAGDLTGEMHYWSWRAAPAGSRFEGDLGPSELAGWRADSARVQVEAPSHSPGTFGVRLDRRGGRVELAADMDHGSWQGTWQASRFPLDEWPDGRATGIRGLLGEGRGTAESRNGTLQVGGVLAGSPAAWLGMQAASWRLGEVSGVLLPKPDLELRDVGLRDVLFLGVHFDSVRAIVHVGDGEARFENVLAAAGDTVVTVAGSSRWGKAGWGTTLERAEARSGQFDWVAEEPVELAGDASGVTFRRFAARDSAARIEIVGRWAAPGGSYDWTGRGTGLDLHRLGLPLEWNLAGSADAVLKVTGRSGDPLWALEGGAVGPGARGHRGDSLHIALEGAPSRLTVRDLVYRLGSGSLQASGVFEGTSRAWPDTLTGEAVMRWLATASSWSGRVSAGALPLDQLERLVPAARGLSGRLGGTLDVSGRPSLPVLGLRMEAAPLAWDSLAAENVLLRAEYRGDKLDVPELRVVRANSVSTASGSMPLRLALGAPPVVTEAPMSWRVDLENGDLALMPQVMPLVAGARGRLDLHCTVGGTPRHPDLAGTAGVRDGQMLLSGRNELIEGLRADFRLEETRITMDSLFARSGRRGTVRADGVIDLDGGRLKHYAFHLAMNAFTAVEPGLYAAEFDAPRLMVTDGPRLNGQVLPHVEGDVTLREARVLFDFANQSETQQLAARTQPLYWTYRIRLLASSNLRWQPPDGDIEFDADLTLEQNEKTLDIFGDLSAIRGTYDFLSNRFNVVVADLTFDNVGGVNPTLDIEATTRVIPVFRGGGAAELQSGTGSQGKVHTITVRITGRAATPTITFESDPGDWDQPTILSQLTLGHYVAGGTVVVSQLSDPLDSYVTRMINAQLSPLLSRTFLRDVGQWRIERQQGGLFGGRGDVFVTMTHQFTPRVQVSYSQRLPGFERPGVASLGSGSTVNSVEQGLLERNVAAEYRLNRFFYITTELAQRRAQTTTTLPTLVPEFNVNLKARWEY
jgi:hypothetical protein